MTRNVTANHQSADPHSTPDDGQNERFRIYRLCECGNCSGTGKTIELGAFASAMDAKTKRCKTCRGEGRSLELVATATDPESVGVALVTLAREEEFTECPIGLMDRPEGETGKWLIKPWLPSARNVSDAGRLLRSQR